VFVGRSFQVVVPAVIEVKAASRQTPGRVEAIGSEPIVLVLRTAAAITDSGLLSRRDDSARKGA
jgi:hypothetical protein